MKKLNLLALATVLLSAGVILITSCNNNDEDPSLIGTWKVTGAVFNPAYDPGTGTPTTDAYSVMFAQPCDQDDLIIFQENGVQIDDEGATKCNSADPQQDMATYTHSGTTITIFDNDTITITNVNIGKEKMTGSIAPDFGSGTPPNIDLTLTRQ